MTTGTSATGFDGFRPPSAVDVRDVLAGIWRRRWMVLLALAGLAAAVAAVYVAVTKPVYTTTSQVLIENLETPFNRPQPNEPDRRLIDDQEITSQVEVLRSTDLAKRVVADLNLTENPDFDPLRRGLSLKSRLMILLGFKTDPRRQTPEQRALSSLESRIKVYPIPRSKVIVVEASAGDPQTAAMLANSLAEIYVTSTREVQSQITAQARAWLSEEIEGLRRKVVESEAAVEEFRAEAGLLKGPTTTLGTQELAELSTQIILAEAQRAEAQAKAKAIRELLARSGTVDTSSEVLNSALIQRLREQQIILQRTLAELSTTYLANHPRIIAVKRELDDLERQVRAEALKIVAGLEQDASIAASREAALRASLDELKRKVSGSNLDEVKLRALEREAAANRLLLESFLNRFSEASARQELSAQPGLARIISRADPPSEPSFPKAGPIVSLAAVAGLALGFGLAFMAEVMQAASRLAEPPARIAPVAPRPTVAAPPVVAVAEAAAAAARPEPAVNGAAAPPEPQPPPSLSMPSLCTVPRPTAAPDPAQGVIDAANDPDGHFAVGLRPLASWCLSLRQTLGVRRIALLATTGLGLDGAAAACALARLLAGQGVKTIVVDADGAPWTMALFGAEEGPGLSDLLGARAEFSDVIVRDAASQAHLLRPGPEAGGDQLAASGRFDVVLDALDHVYDLVLVNAGEAPAGADLSAGVVPLCHAAVLFAAAANLQEAAGRLAEIGRLRLRALQYVRLVDVMPARQQPAARVAVNA